MISDLHQITVDDQDYLLATTFSFCFPFIRCILTNSAMNTEIQEKALQVLSKHCSLRMREEGIDERYSEVRRRYHSYIEVYTICTMVVQYCKTYTGRADGETGFTDRTNGTVREDIYGS